MTHKQALAVLQAELLERDWPAVHLEYVTRSSHELLLWDYGPGEQRWTPHLRPWRLDKSQIAWILGVLRGELPARDEP